MYSIRVFQLLLVALIPLFVSGCFSPKTPQYNPPKNLSTYYEASSLELEEVVQMLNAAGFSLLSENECGCDITIMTFTSSKLKQFAQKSQRGFLLGSMRLLYDNETKKFRITNPEYFVRAYMGESYRLGDGAKLHEKLKTQLTDFIPSSDQLAFEDLGEFQFMKGMPLYDDHLELMRSNSLENIQAKIEKQEQYIVFKEQLDTHTWVYGVQLKDVAKELNKHLGREYSLLFPWNVIITKIEEKGKHYFIAKALDPKYQIALFYPKLDLNSFFSIIALPDAIVQSLQALFK